MRFSQYCERRLVVEMTDGQLLERAIVANPMETTPWGVYADWLDENGDAERAKLARQVMALLGGDSRAVDKVLRIVDRRATRPFDRNYIFWQQMNQRFHCWPEWWQATPVSFRRPLGLQYYWEYFLPDPGEEGNQVFATVVIDPGQTRMPEAVLAVMDRRCVAELEPSHRDRVIEELTDNLELAGWNPRTDRAVSQFMPAAGATAK